MDASVQPVPTAPMARQESASAQVDDRPTSKRLAIVLDSNMPVDVKNCRKSLIEAVKKAGPEGVIFVEIKTTRNSDVLITC